MPLIFCAHDGEMVALTAKPELHTGGEVIFKGLVRGVNHEKVVTFLDYEAHISLATALFLQIEAEAYSRFSIHAISAIHRVGRVEVGQLAVVISVTASHRHEAFLACRYAIDELKRTLPIWRKEVYDDGSFSFEQGAGCSHHLKNSFEQKITPTRLALQARAIDLECIAQKRVLMIGAGGLGCPLAINLLALGVKNLTVYDGDKIETRNLARQFIYKDSDVGFSKVHILKRFIEERYSWVNIEIIGDFIDEKKALDCVHDYDLIIDATDCKYTKRMLKQVAYRCVRPLVSGSVYQSEGEVSAYNPSALGACLGCCENSLHEQGASCLTSGVLTHACALVAALMAERSLALLSKTFFGPAEILLVDALSLHIKTIAIPKDEQCSICGVPLPKQSGKKLVRLVS